MMSCRRVSELAAPEVYETLSTRQKLEFRFHIFMCAHCRRYVRQMRMMGTAMRRAFVLGGGTEDLEDEIVRVCIEPPTDAP
jgi:hypothetical protein